MLASNKFYATWFNKPGSKIAVIEFRDINGNWAGSHAYDFNPNNPLDFVDQVYEYADLTARLKGGRLEQMLKGVE